VVSNFEDELSEHLRSRVESVSASPDLADVEARAARRHGRGRRVAAVGVVAIVAIGIAGIVVVQPRDDGTDPDAAEVASPAPPGTEEPDDADPTGIEPPTDTGAPADTGETATTQMPTTELPSGTIDPVPIDESIGGVVVAPRTAPIPGVDPAQEYLPRTSEIYRRELDDGRAVVARLSDETNASFFDVSWNAPTGNGDECIGDHALLLGVPGEVGFWGSAWTTQPWYDDPATEQSVAIVASAPDAQPGKESVLFHLVRTSAEVAELVLVGPDGREADRVDVVDGLAVLRERSLDVSADPEDAQGPQIRVFRADGTESDPVPMWDVYFSPDIPEQCTPGDPPPPNLPPPGEQPDDPVAAEAQIRARHALLVDRSVARDAKPDDLLDDDTGVEDAVAQVDAGQFSEAAIGATYEIDDIVFTTPDEAWFRYTITASTGVFAGRFGIATFDGDVWQITRATICQDIALAQGECEPPPDAIGQPPPSEEWVQAYEEWNERAQKYTVFDGCSPLSPC
jgi:hypothetical protein